LDTDGDGIPDHHDFCPRAGKRAKTQLAVWLSGRATDFDGDGCEDGVEDPDKDNDGIYDTNDRCPFTPQHYEFKSNVINDFDGDGCADGVEDHDDDGDFVLNTLDRCPRTHPGHSSDRAGCSTLQLEEEATGRHSSSPAQWGSTGRQLQDVGVSRKVKKQAKEKEKEQAPTWQEFRAEWLNLIRSAWVEVLLGAALSSLFAQAMQLVGTLHQQLPASPVASVRHLSSQALDAASRNGSSAKKFLVRALLYVLLFFFVYAYRALQRMKLPHTFPF